MATITPQGTVIAHCRTCDGALATFTPQQNSYVSTGRPGGGRTRYYHLFRCGGCGHGALGVVDALGGFPGQARDLIAFAWETVDQMPLPPDVPEGIVREFREGERCMEAGCYRAAAGMFRSVLDKTLRANGYKLKRGTPLEQQIDLSAADGVITAARQRRAHDEIRVLGNDVLHDEWKPVDEEDVRAARHYAQRILEDFYDDRGSVIRLLGEHGRTPQEITEPLPEEKGQQ